MTMDECVLNVSCSRFYGYSNEKDSKQIAR